MTTPNDPNPAPAVPRQREAAQFLWRYCEWNRNLGGSRNAGGRVCTDKALPGHRYCERHHAIAESRSHRRKEYLKRQRASESL